MSLKKLVEERDGVIDQLEDLAADLARLLLLLRDVDARLEAVRKRGR